MCLYQKVLGIFIICLLCLMSACGPGQNKSSAWAGKRCPQEPLDAYVAFLNDMSTKNMQPEALRKECKKFFKSQAKYIGCKTGNKNKRFSPTIC